MWGLIWKLLTCWFDSNFIFLQIGNYLESSHKRQLALILNDALGIKDAPNFLVIFLIDPVEKAAMRCFFDELIYLRRASIIPDFRVVHFIREKEHLFWLLCNMYSLSIWLSLATSFTNFFSSSGWEIKNLFPSQSSGWEKNYLFPSQS